MLANECRQNGVDAVLNLCVGQRALSSLERKPNRKAHGAAGNTLALVAIEDVQRHQWRGQIASGRQNGATNDFRRQGIGDDDGEIANHQRVAGQRPGCVACRHACALDEIEVDFRDEDAILARQTARVRERWRQLSDDADPTPGAGPSDAMTAAA